MKKATIFYYKYGESILVSKDFMENYQSDSTSIRLKVGNWSIEIPIEISLFLASNEIGIPENLIPFDLPISLSYEVTFLDNILHLGPLIGILLSKHPDKTLSKKRLKRLKMRLNEYQHLNGLIYVFSQAGIDHEKQIIKGHYYIPGKNKEKEKWIEGIFPFPDSLYNRIRLTEKMSESLVSVLGKRVFNTKHFDKAQLWKVCSSDELARSYVPDSIPYSGIEVLIEMINMHKHVYIKPIRGMQGKGIIVAKKSGDTTTFITNDGTRIVCHNLEEITIFTTNYLNNRFGYILQQGIDARYEKHKVDFRFYFQKDQNANWVCQGVVGRIAHEDSIVTNYKYLSQVLSGSKAIQLLFNVNEVEATEIINTTALKCRYVCDLINQKLGHYGDVAIDVILDSDRSPYILEINNRIYQTQSLNKLNEIELLTRISTTPLAYAKTLAGFK
ncbi:YheC/YheD family protein [Bacillus sp. DJP31]|uniref:YheC/YheD family endospore coat-associated protein n=1 Tax=Bacillus sp. DJP31 TaxID=3409789 RepID=UPI003BB75F18